MREEAHANAPTYHECTLHTYSSICVFGSGRNSVRGEVCFCEKLNLARGVPHSVDISFSVVERLHRAH